MINQRSGQSCRARLASVAAKGALGGGLCLGLGMGELPVRAQAPAELLVAQTTVPRISQAIPAAIPETIAQAVTQGVSPLDEGYRLLEKGWVNDAIAAFQSALAADPQALRAKLGLAMAYQRAGRDGDAWDAYQTVLLQQPDQLAALQAVGTLGSYRPEWQQPGIAALNRLLERQPQDDALRAQRALLLGYQQRFPEAIADYEILLRAPTPAPAILLNAAQIYTYSDRPDVALPLFQRYLQTRAAPLDRPATFAYATALRKQNQPGEAIALLNALQPTNAQESFERLIGLSLAHQATGDGETALATLQPTLNPLLPDLQQRRAIATVLVAFDPPPPSVLPTLQELLLDPEPVTFLHFRATQIQLAGGDLSGARQSLLAYQATLSSMDIGTEFLLAELDRRDGKLEESGDRYRVLLGMTEGETQLDALRGLAAIRFEQQRLSEAEGLYRQVIAQRPTDLEARRTFAELLLAQDQPKQALAEFGVAQAGDRQRSVRRSFLKRRGFQPSWERY